MSYTNMKVTWESAGEVDTYNDIQYGSAVTISVRKQPRQELIRTSDGREILCRSIFFVDPYVEPRAASIKRLDKLDGEKVEDTYVMCDRMNRPKMYRFITV